MADSHTTIPTTAPRERALVVQVEESVFAKDPDILPPEDTGYNDCGKYLFETAYNKKYDGYVFKEQRGDHGLLFVKRKTPEQRATPVLEYSEVRDCPWPAVLQWIKFSQEYGFPLSQNYIQGGNQGIATVPRWLVQYSWIPGMTLKTVVKVREFLSDAPYPSWAVESNDPKPTSISWDLIGSHGNLGICLHPEILVPGQGDNAGIRVVLTEGRAQSGNSGQRGQKFPRTNHTSWTDYTVNTVRRIDGQYHRLEESFVAPDMPRPSLLEN